MNLVRMGGLLVLSALIAITGCFDRAQPGLIVKEPVSKPFDPASLDYFKETDGVKIPVAVYDTQLEAFNSSQFAEVDVAFENWNLQYKGKEEKIRWAVDSQFFFSSEEAVRNFLMLLHINSSSIKQQPDPRLTPKWDPAPDKIIIHIPWDTILKPAYEVKNHLAKVAPQNYVEIYSITLVPKYYDTPQTLVAE